MTLGRHLPTFEPEARQIREWIAGADRVLIGAGAGLSADAGVDYTDEVDFAANFPALVKRGLRAEYQMIGYSKLPPAAPGQSTRLGLSESIATTRKWRWTWERGG